jgi:hypothetical protein
MAFEYSNLNDRSPGWFLRLARRLLPGVGLVENEIKPYAQAWHERNLGALASADPLWMVLGDSLSQGVGASSIEHSWVLQTQRALADRGRAVSRPRSTGSWVRPRTPAMSWRCHCTSRPARVPRTISTPTTPATRRSPPTSPPRSWLAGDLSGLTG